MNYEIYVGGQFVKTNTELPVINPFTNNAFATTYLAGKNELETAITKALEVQKQMKQMPSFKRFEILKFVSEEILRSKQYLAEILSQECAKPIKYAISEIERAAQTFLIAAEEAKRLPKEYISLDVSNGGIGKEGFVKYFPIGLVAGIAPFNFPMNLAVHKIAPALAAGNCIILKPARSTPLSTLELAKIIDQTELPKGAFSVLPMDREAGNQLVTDERFRLISFTGSPEVGWKMKQQAGTKKVLLELGGNAGVLVTKLANLEIAVPKCVAGAFAYSGQICIHAQRIYVEESIFEKFLELFVKKTKSIVFGNPLDPKTDISSMIDLENAERVEKWIQEAVEKGAKIVWGGKRNGNYVDPTILTNTCNEMKVCCLEVFGPVVVIEKVKNFDEGIEKINNSQFGLQAGVFTDSWQEINFAYNNLEVGGVIINDVPTFRVDNMPYGGVKNSGFGREGVRYSIIEQMEPKLLVIPNTQ